MNNLWQKQTFPNWMIILMLILLLTFGSRINKATLLGTQSDEGLHIVTAELILKGHVLYRDLFENRTPLVEWSLAGFFGLTGPSITVARSLNALIAAVTGAGMIFAGHTLTDQITSARENRKISNPSIGTYGAILFAVAPLAVFWGRFVMLENWQAAGTVLGVGSAMVGTRKHQIAWWFWAGFFVALATLGKQTGVVGAFALFIFQILLLISHRNSKCGKSILAFFSGFLLPLLIFGLVLFAQNAFKDFIISLSGLERLDPLENLSQKLTLFIQWTFPNPLFWLAIIGCIYLLRRRQVELLILPLWLFAENFAVFLPPRMDVSWGGFSHYWLTAITAYALAGGVGIYWLVENVRVRGRQRTLSFFTVFILCIMMFFWLSDLFFVVRRSEYPVPDITSEISIGEMASQITPEESSIVVLANSVFYHWANREPASRFFHFPAYLTGSSMEDIALQELAVGLQDPNTDAVVISRMHLEDRLPAPIRNIITANWEPFALLPYEYQRDVFLFRPRENNWGSEETLLAKFDGEISLVEANVDQIADNRLAIRLLWETQEPIETNLIAFAHLLDSAGSLIAQHDSVPSVGFRPTNSWQIGERIVDWHIIQFPSPDTVSDAVLTIGLYDSNDGVRIARTDSAKSEDFYLMPVDIK